MYEASIAILENSPAWCKHPKAGSKAPGTLTPSFYNDSEGISPITYKGRDPMSRPRHPGGDYMSHIRHEFSDGKEESCVIGFGIAKVIDSNNSKFPVGALVFSPSGWEEYSHIHESQYLNEVTLLDGLPRPSMPLSAYNGVLGVPEFTIWDSLNSKGDLKASETIYISSAAGTLGQFAGQLAKRKGLRVIGSAGSDEKAAFLKNGHGLWISVLALAEAAGPAGLDIYYELVGDDTVEIALDLLNPCGRILAVGILAAHQNAEPYLPKNLDQQLVQGASL
ncbi:hypothetical protein BGZ79_001120 [Entomortierella chlamydospora]|nr:hypothetical protein BGZ79_001120 [Entomortierella chlamydospora]